MCPLASRCSCMCKINTQPKKLFFSFLLLSFPAVSHSYGVFSCSPRHTRSNAYNATTALDFYHGLFLAIECLGQGHLLVTWWTPQEQWESPASTGRLRSLGTGTRGVEK